MLPLRASDTGTRVTDPRADPPGVAGPAAEAEEADLGVTTDARLLGAEVVTGLTPENETETLEEDEDKPDPATELRENLGTGAGVTATGEEECVGLAREIRGGLAARPKGEGEALAPLCVGDGERLEDGLLLVVTWWCW